MVGSSLPDRQERRIRCFDWPNATLAAGHGASELTGDARDRARRRATSCVNKSPIDIGSGRILANGNRSASAESGHALWRGSNLGKKAWARGGRAAIPSAWVGTQSLLKSNRRPVSP